jgi:hypothetical protein
MQNARLDRHEFNYSQMLVNFSYFPQYLVASFRGTIATLL